MHNNKVLDDLAYIKQMMQLQTRNSAANASPFFILWGTVWIIGFGAEALGFEHILHIVWGSASAIAMIINIWLVAKLSKEDPLPTVFDRKLSMLLGSFGIIAGLIVVLIISGFLNFHYEVIGLYAVILTAILYLLLGVILGKEIFIMGIWLAVLAAINALWFPPYHAGLLTLVGGASFLLTGLALRRWRRNNG